MKTAPAPLPPPDLTTLVRRGTRAVLLAQIGSQAVSLITLACLTRLIPATAFGLLAVVLPLVMLPRMAATLGFGAAAIQRPDADDALLSGLFWRCFGWSLVAAMVTGCSGAVLAWLYRTPVLTAVALALSAATALNALSVVHLSLMERELRMRAVSLARLASQTVAAMCALVAAWWGGGVWALVVQHVVEFVLLAGLAWSLCSWRPLASGWHLPRETRQFGSYYALSSLLVYAAQNVDKLLLAAWLGTSPRAQALVGMYAQSYHLMMRPVYLITTPLVSMMLPTLARVQHEVPAKIRWTEHYFRLAAWALLPAGVGLWLVAGDLMQIIAPRWPEAGGILAALAPVILAQGFINLAGIVLAALGRTGLLAFGAAVQLLVLLQAVTLGAWIGSRVQIDALDAIASQTIATAFAVSIATTLVILLPFLAFVSVTSGIPLRRFAAAMFPVVPAALFMGAAVYAARWSLLFTSLPTVARLGLCVSLGAAVYGLLTLRHWRGALRPA